MNSDRRFEQELPSLLDDLFVGPMPTYRDSILEQTARTRQRPAWSFPERWLPMLDIARQPLLMRRVPWRPIVALALLLLVVIATALFYAGSHRVPAPFGLARNGVVAYSEGGDIHTTDPVTGNATTIVTGSETDLRPVFSLDGSRFAFERKAVGQTGPGRLFVANVDGTGLTLVTPEPLSSINSYVFSPDGREILVSAGAGDSTTVSIVPISGGASRPLVGGDLIARDPAFRGPDGKEILFVGNAPGEAAMGLYAVKSDGTALRTIVAPTNMFLGSPKSSPDGTQIAYNAVGVDYDTNPATPLLRVYLVGADGGTPRILRDHPIDDLEGVIAWSNDGTRLLISGCFRSTGVDACPSKFQVVPTNGTGSVVGVDFAAGIDGADGTRSEWAPDDTSIITTPLDGGGRPMGAALSWDSRTGQSQPVPWTGAGAVSWQRLAP